MKQQLLVVALLAGSLATAQQRDSVPNGGAARGALSAAFGQVAGGARQTPRPYREVITDKAVSKKGMFTVHKVEDRYYFEIGNAMLGREILAVTRYIKVPANGGGRGAYGGEIANQQTLAFEKGPSNNVFLRVITLVNAADPKDDIYKAVSNSNLNAITAAFPIAAFSKDSSAVVIEVTDFFKGDNQVVSINSGVKRSLGLAQIASDRSFIQKLTPYPINVEIRTVKTFTASPAVSSFGPVSIPGGGTSVPAANAAGAVTLELNTSLLLLPEKAMTPRIADKRVGFFTEDYVLFSDDQQKVENKEFAVRWRLEPKDEDLEKWKRGELVEPKKPIIYYIDPATPKQWRKHLILGVNDWQKAFEKAGFKNAIMGKEWPENDTTMSMEDARFSVIRYFASSTENAYGPNVHDPRSGEILESHIGWYHNVMKLVHDWYMVQTAAVDPRARKMKFDDDLMGDLIRFVSSHEVGHTLGLRHNMGSSSKTPVAKLRDKTWVEANGHTASIMDYARFNYVAQPEDNISKEGLYPRIGDYDQWAMKWGYGHIPGNSEEEVKKNSSKLITETLKANPRTWFGTYESGNQSDPRSQSEDLSDNAVVASDYGVKNLQRILVKLPEWTKEDADLNDNIEEMYGQLLGQFRRYVGHVSRNIGGVYETFKTAEQDEPVYEITPKTMQRDALGFLNRQLFQTPKWLIDKKILDKINPPGTVDPIASAQESALAGILSGDRLNRMQYCVERFGADKAYSALDMLGELQADLFSELRSNKTIDGYRRMLQKSYVDKLNNLINPPATTASMTIIFSSGRPNPYATGLTNRSDVYSIARAQLVQLRSQVSAAAASATDRMSKIHLQDLSEKIKKALDPK
ncbi:MAG: zinc-dependent metalloprotease [Bacteroidetes bacterium]|nr:zinc-dependent metalloprotease [Bacteroidota bacterium]